MSGGVTRRMAWDECVDLGIGVIVKSTHDPPARRHGIGYCVISSLSLILFLDVVWGPGLSYRKRYWVLEWFFVAVELLSLSILRLWILVGQCDMAHYKVVEPSTGLPTPPLPSLRPPLVDYQSPHIPFAMEVVGKTRFALKFLINRNLDPKDG